MLEKLPGAIGHALRDQRAGLDEIVFNTLGLRSDLGTIEVTSLAFADHSPIPARYTADGPGLSPPLAWRGVPAGATQVVLVVEDADSPTPNPLVHAIVVDLHSEADCALAEGALTSPDRDRGDEGVADLHEGRNSYLTTGWLPPDPPPGHGTHRYAFQVYAVRSAEPWSGTPGRDAVKDVLAERCIAAGLLVGTYTRPDGSIRTEDAVPGRVSARQPI